MRSPRSLRWWQLIALLAALRNFVTEAENEDDAKYPPFMQWLEQGGANIQGVALSDFGNGRPVSSVGVCAQDGVNCYRGVVATQDIASGSVVVSVPLELGAYDFDGAVNLPEPYAESISETRLAAWLCRERSLGAASRFAQYLDMLPKRIPTPLFYEHHEAELVALLPVYARIQELRNWTRREYDKSSSEALGGASFDTFKWAFANVLSRTFESRVLLGEPGEEFESSMILMLPFADMVNHSPHNQLVWSLDESGQRFEMTATRDVQEGEEVFATYGSKTNEQWLLYYGYVPEDNPADKMPLFDTVEEAANWYVDRSQSTSGKPHAVPHIAAAVSQAAKAASVATGDSPVALEEQIVLVDGESDVRLHAVFATMWSHLDSKAALGYACTPTLNPWYYIRRLKCDLEADKAASSMVQFLYRSSLDSIAGSLAKVKRKEILGLGATTEVLERYLLIRKTLVEQAIGGATSRKGVEEAERRHANSKDL